MGMAMILALALSLDGFGVGMAYGLKRIRIPLSSMMIIGFCTALAMTVSMYCGHLITSQLTVIHPGILGAVVLIAIGLYQLIQTLRNRAELPEAVPVMVASVGQRDDNPYRTLFSIHLNFFGLVIQVLQTPDAADIDGSGVITLNESLLLGVALSLDAFASGVAAALTGIFWYVIGMVTLMQVLMIFTGQVLTGRLPASVLARVRYLPGIVLILIGSLKII
jgi:putative sporulation protein YtaF